MSFTAPEPLATHHEVAHFDCGKPALNTWLHKRALANQESGSTRTFVVCTDRRVVAYYALAAGSVVHDEAIGSLRRNMPDPVPMALLGRLAVDTSAQGFGIGVALLRDAVVRVLQASQALGIRGIMVDALDEQAASFYQKFGFRPSAALPLKLMVSLREIEQAVR